MSERLKVIFWGGAVVLTGVLAAELYMLDKQLGEITDSWDKELTSLDCRLMDVEEDFINRLSEKDVAKYGLKMPTTEEKAACAKIMAQAR